MNTGRAQNTGSWDSLSAFTLIWGWSEFFHFISFFPPEHGALSALGLIWGLSILAVLFRPGVLSTFSVMLFFDILFQWAKGPVINHILFNTIVDATILAAFFTASRPATGQTADRSHLADLVAYWLRLELLLLYFFTVLHKLNRDFFNPDVSCGATFLLTIKKALPFLPAGWGARLLSVWGTIGIECAIPILLCYRKTRRAGLLLGVGFHFFLGLYPHPGLYSFSAMMFALFYAFIPREAFRASLGPAARLWHGLRWMAVLALAVTAGGYFLSLSGHYAIESESFYQLGFGVWLCAEIVIAACVLLPGRVINNADSSLVKNFKAISRMRWVYLFPMFIIFHSLNPYLGLKTTPCLSMFSNLRTEGAGWNHFFIPRAFKVFGFQDDLVEIVSSSDPELQRAASKEKYIPYFEVQRAVAKATGQVQIEFIRNGTLTRLAGSRDELRSQIALPPPWLSRYLRFRAINKQGPMACCR